MRFLFFFLPNIARNFALLLKLEKVAFVCGFEGANSAKTSRVNPFCNLKFRLLFIIFRFLISFTNEKYYDST